MDDVSLFRKIISAYGGKPGIATSKLRGFLRSQGVADETIEYIGEYALKKSAYVGAIDFYSTSGWLGANAEDFVPICLRDGLLIVGSCPNGDPVVVDLRVKLGEAGYVGHESMWQVINTREVFIVLSPSLGQLVAGIDQKRMPIDYYSAQDRK